MIHEPLDRNRLVRHVFVPGAMGAGLLVSLLMLVGDGWRRLRGGRAARRTVELRATTAAVEVIHGLHASECDRTGFRPRLVYGIVAAASLGLGAYLVPGATWNFLKPNGYLSDIGWIWALSLLAVMGFTVVGLAVLRAAPEFGAPLAIIVGSVATARAVWLAGSIWVPILAVLGVVTTVTVALVAWRLHHDDRIPPLTRAVIVATPLARVPD